ncbi:MAG: hypothetical protein ACI9DF_005189 [Verrucomicrobiales bacterium]|jgi:hypothetical protein
MRYLTIITIITLACTLVSKADQAINLGIYEKAVSLADPGDLTVTLNVLLDSAKLDEKRPVATQCR